MCKTGMDSLGVGPGPWQKLPKGNKGGGAWPKVLFVLLVLDLFCSVATLQETKRNARPDNEMPVDVAAVVRNAIDESAVGWRETGETYAKGHREGDAEGYARGLAEGEKQGMTKGGKEGYERGFAVGKKEGYAQGTRDGFSKGREEGVKQGREQVVKKRVSEIQIGSGTEGAKLLRWLGNPAKVEELRPRDNVHDRARWIYPGVSFIMEKYVGDYYVVSYEGDLDGLIRRTLGQ